jgi:hypothetical protein
MKSNLNPDSSSESTAENDDTPVGCRVGVILSADDTTVQFLGWGTYEGDFIPPELSNPDVMLERMREMAPALEEQIGLDKLLKDFQLWNKNPIVVSIFGNPRIKLDSGKTVWGYECYWGPESKMRDYIGGRQIVEVDIEEERAKAAVTNALSGQKTSRN